MSTPRPSDLSTEGLPDGNYLFAIVDGVGEWLETDNPVGTDFVPLTTAINGVPELVWDSNNNLIFTEAP